MKKKCAEYRWVWLLVAAATVGFIWQQSTLPPADSAEVSNAVGGVLATLLGGAESPLARFVSRFVRKIAHFTEFAILGLECEAYLLGRHLHGTTALELGFGLLVAAADESIQLFTERGAAFTDVLLDFSGFLAAVILLRLAFFLKTVVTNKRKGGSRAAQNDA